MAVFTALAVLSLLTFLYILITDVLCWYRMPRGPQPLPFIGNKFLLSSTTKPWIRFREWSETYGPIFTIWVGRRPTIIISDPEIAVDLMEKRSNIYSSRPRFVVMGEIYSDSASILVQPYGKAWSLRRKLLHQALTPRALETYKKRQEAEASRLVYQVMLNPETWERAFDRFTASVVFSISYGHRVDSPDAAVIRERLEYMQYMASLNVPGAYLAESLPFLKYLPGFLAPWKVEVQREGQRQIDSNMALMNIVQQEMNDAKAGGKELPSSLTSILLEMRDREGIAMSDRDISFLPASLFGAGSDTTASTLCSGILALVTNQHILQIAQAELDSVVGSSRSPTFSDEVNLPYIRALCSEILRWRPVAVLGGTPHASTQDDIYKGYRIPADTTILGNTWAINHNREYYPSPDTFNPARFLSPSDPRYVSKLKGKTHPSKDRGHSSFGWGRRICPGAGLAENSLFVAVAKLVWAFEIKGLEGGVYDTMDYTDGFNIRPKSFRCVIRIRSEERAEVLKREFEEAEREMERFSAFI